MAHTWCKILHSDQIVKDAIEEHVPTPVNKFSSSISLLHSHLLNSPSVTALIPILRCAATISPMYLSSTSWSSACVILPCSSSVLFSSSSCGRFKLPRCSARKGGRRCRTEDMGSLSLLSCPQRVWILKIWSSEGKSFFPVIIDPCDAVLADFCWSLLIVVSGSASRYKPRMG